MCVLAGVLNTLKHRGMINVTLKEMNKWYFHLTNNQHRKKIFDIYKEHIFTIAWSLETEGKKFSFFSFLREFSVAFIDFSLKRLVQQKGN